MNSYKIVKIIDDMNVVVNMGAGVVDKDDILEVYVVGDIVEDPETKEELGTLDFIKARLRVKTVYENMCLCTNAATTTTNPFISAAEKIGSMSITKIVPLDVDMSEASGGFSSFDKTIRIGDLVRKTLS